MKRAALFLLFLFLVRGFIFRKTVTYTPLSNHPAFELTDSSFRHYIEKQTPVTGIDAAIQQALDATAGRLSFSSDHQNSDPNDSFHSRRAHCVGYAAFFATTCTAILKKNGLGDSWTVSHVRGEIHFLGINLNSLFNSPFFKDHDYNIVENITTGEQYLVDATVRDYLLLYFIKKPGTPSFY